ncbi:transcription initiation factor TFIID subunit [Musa troglodytarum]|uniref:Transcription initiation factor TFIID subunit n=1 Tax=Musa troglodytarum TaxID=320322 RepID=A0A9E7JCB3_9LILI|nr:transcription initiation factor TFIID subunit [Musa troglodytarum]
MLASGVPMEEEELQKAVVAYLRKKGFTKTEIALQEEQQNRLSSSSHPDLPLSRLENDPARYSNGYSKLRSWAYSSLDLYKHELLLCSIQYTSTASWILWQKVICKMYAYDLLLQYLQKTQSLTILGIINERINFEVSPGQPISISDDMEVVALVGSSHDLAKQINQKEVRWGLLEDSVEDRLERANSDSEKAEAENKELDPEDNKAIVIDVVLEAIDCSNFNWAMKELNCTRRKPNKRSVDGGKQAAPVKKLKKDKLVGATGKMFAETSTVPVAPRVKPELTLPIILNCSAISQDGSLVAGGFSDSSLKVWDMSKIGQSAKPGENDSIPSEHFLGTEGEGSYTLFHGHCGPIYSATFSPLGDFLLSSSSDSTIRLWSTNLNANLVCYKGHNYPVWDVQASSPCEDEKSFMALSPRPYYSEERRSGVSVCQRSALFFSLG